MRKQTRQTGLALALLLAAADARAEGCPTAKDDIATDRPSVANSSLVVPTGSFLSENGVDFSAADGSRMIDGTNTRWRLGIAPCLEVLVDLPSYSATIAGPASSGFSDVGPAIKWQISPVPGKIDLSIIAGAKLPTGALAIAGPGTQPYLQAPWTWAFDDGWGIGGMLSEYFRPQDASSRSTTEATFLIQKNLTPKATLFVEYVGDYPENGGPSHLLNSGGTFRITPTQQIDFHIAFGLNHNAPNYVVGAGYSFRLDGLFAGQPK